MSPFQLAALFLTLMAAIGWLNVKVLRLPQGVAMLLVALVGALIFLVLRWAAPGWALAGFVPGLIGRIDFPETVVGYMLAFLLFAGAMQVDLGEMRRRRLSVWTLATLGVLASTLIVGLGVWAAARALGLALTLPWAFVFGALISPTDPVAVLSTVKHGGLSKRLQAILQGEALFNDGVGIVVFLAALAFATGGRAPDYLGSALSVIAQAGGGLVLGLLGGWAAIRAMRTIDAYEVEVSITLALAVGVYALGQALHLSGPIAAVAAGLLVGDHGVRTAMSPTTQRYVQGFWTLIDELLNALLFLLLGLELLVLPFDLRSVGLWLIAIPLVVVARLATVLPWGAYFRFRQNEVGASLILTWGGLHGALSLALALSVPAGPARSLILSVTYAVVVFSVVVQGLSFGPLVNALGRLSRTGDTAPLPPPG
jgi:CPA1 family monovalent cation:H+ antiporter